MKYLIITTLYLIAITSCHNDKDSASSYMVKWNLGSVERVGSTNSIENVLLLNTINKSKTTVTISDDLIQFYQNDTLIETHKIKISGTKILFLKEGDNATEGIIAQSGDNLTITIDDYVYKLTKN